MTINYSRLDIGGFAFPHPWLSIFLVGYLLSFIFKVNFDIYRRKRNETIEYIYIYLIFENINWLVHIVRQWSQF